MAKQISENDKRHIIMETPKEIPFEVSVQPESGGRSAFAPDATPSLNNLDAFRVPADKMIQTRRLLQNAGVTVHKTGDFTISAACPKSKFEKLFNTRLLEKTLEKSRLAPPKYTYLAPEERIQPPKIEGLKDLVERVYIQPPPILFAGERPIPPFWNDKFRLRVTTDVAQIIRASEVHHRGITGKGVRVAMPDTGFYHHPYFQDQGYNFLAVTAPDALDHTTDSYGHGTGECANLFAVAPGISFTGVKMGASLVLAFKTAVELRPQVMTNSWGYSVDMPGTTMPNWLVPLYLEVLNGVAHGIIVCFSAGNGHFGFPGSIPEVISAGGVIVDQALNYSATPYASGFTSTWFPGRNSPDVCGLCGTLPTADYIVLPVQHGATLEKQQGWGAFSGTSACSPMVAGVCALLKQADHTLTREQIRSILKFTARDITTGHCAMGYPAGPGPDLATGFGLVDAARALDAVL